MGPRGGPGAACPDLTIARITFPTSNFFTTLAALEIFDILLCVEILKSALKSTENPSTENREEKQISASRKSTTATNHLHAGLIKTSYTQINIDTLRLKLAQCHSATGE